MAKNYKVIGKPLPRTDGFEKVTGKAKYTADLNYPGSWVAGVLRSQVAAGRLKEIKKNPKFNWGQVAVITAQDLPGPNVVAMIRDDYEILAQDRITYGTQALALVAAPNAEILKEALANLEAVVEEEPPVLTIEDSLACKSIVWGENNVIDEFNINKGNMEKGFQEADYIFEAEFKTGYQEHISIEGQAMMAFSKDKKIHVLGSLQCPFYVHNALATALKMKTQDVIVQQALIGGAFGAKEEYPSVIAVWVALLAIKTGKVVKLIYDRAEDILVTTKRHPSKSHYKVGVKKDGSITAVDLDFFLDAGANTTMTKVVLSRATLHSTSVYKVPNAKIRARSMATNTPPNGAFRGFGAPQGIFGMERMMDIIAEKLNLNPVAVREKNAMANGDTFTYGQNMPSGIYIKELLKDVVARSDFLNKYNKYQKQEGQIRKGIGLSLCMHGGGFTGSAEDNMGTTVEVEYNKNGLVSILTSSTDMGQGANIVLPMIAAEALQVPVENVLYPLPNTAIVPNSGPTVASRTTMFVGRVLHDACVDLIEKLKIFLQENKKLTKLEYKDGVFQIEGKKIITFTEACDLWVKEKGNLKGRNTLQPDPNTVWDEEKYEGSAYKGYSWLAQAIEIEVDLDTYEIRLLNSYASVEAGTAINPLQYEGQVEGGVLQSYGMGYLEDLHLNEKGFYHTTHLNGYLIPTTLDTPNFEVSIFEDPNPVGGYGAKGLGELTCDGGPSAVLAAVQNACGVVACVAPLMGEDLFNLLEDGPEDASIVVTEVAK